METIEYIPAQIAAEYFEGDPNDLFANLHKQMMKMDDTSIRTFRVGCDI